MGKARALKERRELAVELSKSAVSLHCSSCHSCDQVVVGSLPRVDDVREFEATRGLSAATRQAGLRTTRKKGVIESGNEDTVDGENFKSKEKEPAKEEVRFIFATGSSGC